MTFPIEPPPHWPRFLQLVHDNAPVIPDTGQTEAQRDRAAAAQALGVITTLLGALGVNIPDAADVVITGGGIAGTSSSGADVASGIADAAVGRVVTGFAGGPAGLIVGNGIAVLRGAIQAIQRSDAMVTYLLGTSGYVQTLARLAIKATRDPVPYLSMPDPVVPDYAASDGSLYSSWRRGTYSAGFERARRVKESIDEVRPVEGDHYSKRIFIHVYLQGNTNLHLPQEGNGSWRVRIAIEDYILRQILVRDLARQRERLRRWAMRG